MHSLLFHVIHDLPALGHSPHIRAATTYRPGNVTRVDIGQPSSVSWDGFVKDVVVGLDNVTRAYGLPAAHWLESSAFSNSDSTISPARIRLSYPAVISRA
jgi:hypothetical protein